MSTEYLAFLENPGFEDGFRPFDDIGPLMVAKGWTPWWDAKAARPEYKDATTQIDANRVRSGAHAQQWFNSWRTHTAGVYQRVADLPAGAIHFEAWVQCWSSNKDDAAHSDGRYRMRIGIGPYGAISPDSPDIVWSNDGNAVQPYDAYEKLEVSCESKSDRATFWIWGQAEWAVKNNNAYVDDCRAWVVTDQEPGPEPPPEPVEPSDLVPILYDGIDALGSAIYAAYEVLDQLRDRLQELRDGQ